MPADHAPVPQREVIADRGDAGRRLDLVLSRHLADVAEATRTQIQRWIEDGQVAVNGVAARRVSRRIAAGDAVIVTLPAGTVKPVMAGEAAALSIVYEDEHLLVVDKPAGLVSHPTHAHAAGTLLNALTWYARTWPDGHRPSLVSRLDKWTSGLVVVAKTAATHAALQRTMASTGSVKAYLALVYGEPTPSSGDIALRLARDTVDRRRVVASTTRGAPSRTSYEVIATANPGSPVTLVRCRLATGRTHQIRVHLAARGWPIAGDTVYGEPRWEGLADPDVRTALATFPRQALHANRVGFAHPSTDAWIDIVAPLPADMVGLLKACGLPPVAAMGK